MSLGETLYWRDRNMPEPPLEPPYYPEPEEEDDGDIYFCDQCAHAGDGCALRRKLGNRAAAVCVDFEEGRFDE